MKINLYILFAFILHFSNVFVSAKTPLSVDQKARLDAIAQRALNGNDPKALEETIDFPPDIILPYLEQYILKYKDEKGPYFEAARGTFIKFPDYEKPYAEKLAIATSKGYVDADVFNFLELIATPKAAAVIAPYLFDYTESPSGTGHGLSDLNALNAGYSLGKMNLSDAPTKTKPGSYNGADYLAWRQWAIDKGYVPKTTNPALPEWMIHMNVTPTPYVIPTPLADAPKTTPIPSPTVKASALSTTQKAQSSLPIVIGMILFLTVVFGTVFYRRKF